jgi:hypothetical protein
MLHRVIYTYIILFTHREWLSYSRLCGVDACGDGTEHGWHGLANQPYDPPSFMSTRMTAIAIPM